MSVPEPKQGKPVRTDSCFLSLTLSQCTFLVFEDLCRVIPAVSWAPFQYVPVIAGVLTLGQQQINSSAQSGPIEINGTFQQQLVPNVTIQHLIQL